MTIARVIGIALALLLFFDGHSFGRPAAQVAATKAHRNFSRRHCRAEDSGSGSHRRRGTYGKTTIPFFSNGSGFHGPGRRGYRSQAGLSSSHGQVYDVDRGRSATDQISLRIKPKSFKKESFSVAAEFDQLSPEVLERIRKDQDQFSRAFMTSTPERLWDGRFLLPISSEVSSPFGYRRVINGTPSSAAHRR